jgi:membrane glycosyltransferase
MNLWQIPLQRRRWLIIAATPWMTLLVLGVFARGFFIGPADWVVALAGALLGVLCLFGHFSWLLWVIGFCAWRSRPKEEVALDTPLSTRTALVMPIYHEDVARVAAGIRRIWASCQRAGQFLRHLATLIYYRLLTHPT